MYPKSGRVSQLNYLVRDLERLEYEVDRNVVNISGSEPVVLFRAEVIKERIADTRRKVEGLLDIIMETACKGGDHEKEAEVKTFPAFMGAGQGE